MDVPCKHVFEVRGGFGEELYTLECEFCKERIYRPRSEPFRTDNPTEACRRGEHDWQSLSPPFGDYEKDGKQFHTPHFCWNCTATKYFSFGTRKTSRGAGECEKCHSLEKWRYYGTLYTNPPQYEYRCECGNRQVYPNRLPFDRPHFAKLYNSNELLVIDNPNPTDTLVQKLLSHEDSRSVLFEVLDTNWKSEEHSCDGCIKNSCSAMSNSSFALGVHGYVLDKDWRVVLKQVEGNTIFNDLCPMCCQIFDVKSKFIGLVTDTTTFRRMANLGWALLQMKQTTQQPNNIYYGK